VTEQRLSIDDGNAMPVLCSLISEPQPMASSTALCSVSCKALTRLEYPTLQAMLALKTRVTFCDLEHLVPALERYGLHSQFLSAEESLT
jgi:hypothetical protein